MKQWKVNPIIHLHLGNSLHALGTDQNEDSLRSNAPTHSRASTSVLAIVLSLDGDIVEKILHAEQHLMHAMNCPT